MNQIPDQTARNNALDTTHSFIIQAPAGSGKTSLLTQRYLSLLAKVENPEEIVAITFTKKAAAEMQQRIIEALLLAKEAPPKEPYLQKTFQLASDALKQNQLKKWDVFHNKQRLRILTIDAFCLFLTSKMPLLSKAIPYSSVADDPLETYRLAAIRTLQTAAQNSEFTAELEMLQAHLGNNQAQLIELFILMLQKRDQWLAHVLSARRLDKSYFIQVLHRIQQELCEQFNFYLPESIIELLEQVIHYQSSFCEQSIIKGNENIEWDNFKCLKKISELLLSSTGTARKRFTKKEGFPPATAFKHSEEKIAAKKVKELLSQLSQYLEENSETIDVLKQIKMLPVDAYSDKQWDILNALLKLLPLLAAELSVIFNQTSQVDFNEISMQALHALGIDLPTELALYLDYEINHLLIDEFQDTSKKQYLLLERLTESWYEGDGKTLFLVGDPMQSIYRFREANVGLFLKIKQFGINQIKIKPLQLSCNFRSSAGLINEVNKICNSVFPTTENIDNGAVCYSPSETLNENNNQAFYGIRTFTKQDEAKSIKNYIKSHPKETIAILIRSRSQLKKIVPLLKKESISIEGVNLEKLNTTYLINLLLSLTRYLLNPKDILSLASILNSPLCGLNTLELEILLKDSFPTGSNYLQSLLERSHQFVSDSQQRIKKIISIFQHSHHHAYRKNISEMTHDLWLHLHGDLLIDETNQDDINQFWQLLAKHNKWPIDINVFERQLKTKYSEQNSQCQVKIMTIHRSKGLEFDTVILPSIDYAGVDKNTNLLNWFEKDDDFLLSPIHSVYDDKDPLVTYINALDKKKEHYERQRLFYVALTRAKNKLILINSSSEDKKATKGSFQYYLQDHVSFKSFDSESEEQKLDISTSIKAVRLKQDEFINAPTLKFIEKSNDIPAKIRKESKQIIGDFIHQQLFYLSEMENGGLTIKTNKQYIINKLLNMGLRETDIEMANSIYRKCIKNINSSEIGRWIFKDRSSCLKEYKLNTSKGAFIIDRTFLDNDTRWIIDYKISEKIDNNKDTYIKQLNNYADLFHKMGEYQIKLMLYYPLIDQSIQWHSKKSIADQSSNS